MRTTPGTIIAVLAISTCVSLTAQAAPPDGGPSPGSMPAPMPAVAPTATPVAAAATGAISSAAPASVLERFRTYSGSRTPAALSGLFSAPVREGVRQKPEVVLSNGAVTVSVAAVIPAQGNTAPNFAFKGARLISNAQLTKDEWLVEALPETGAMDVEMVVLSNGIAQEIPLTVAPPLPAETDLSEKGFVAFLGDTKPGAKPLQDLNGDGRRDYLDDYIFTVNYLSAKRSGPAGQSSAPGAQKPQSAYSYSTDNSTGGAKTGSTTAGKTANPDAVTTITSPSGNTLKYTGTDKNKLNLRNLKAKDAGKPAK